MRCPLALFLALGPLLSAAPVTPAAGSKDHKEILDTVRDPIEDVLHRPVIFKVNHLKIEKGWAFLDAKPLTKDGKPMSYEGTMYEEWVEDADEVLWVLLRNKRGRWYIVEKVFFTTDVTWVEWPQYFRAPPSIFPKLKLD